MRPDLKLISIGEIKAEEVKWLWYPYLPRGKLTIVLGNPGEGKTTFVLAVIAALTRGESLPESGHHQTTAGRRRRGLFPGAGHRREPAGADAL